MDLGTSMWQNNDLLKGYKLQPALNKEEVLIALLSLDSIMIAWHHGRHFTDFKTNTKCFSMMTLTDRDPIEPGTTECPRTRILTLASLESVHPAVRKFYPC
jgi:hypothetical protein